MPPEQPTSDRLLPLTGDTAGLLGAPSAEAAPRDRTLTFLYGWDFAGTKALWPEVGVLPWPEAVVRLRQGIEVQIDCKDKLAGMQRPIRGSRAVKHRLRLHPDGHITMLDHLDRTAPPDGHSDHLDHDNEMFLYSLGGPLPTCVSMVLWLLGEQRDPGQARALAKTYAPHVGPVWFQLRPNALRTLYAAVAWAQHATNAAGEVIWPASAWERYLKAGTTPRVLSHWVEHGWNAADATLFLSERASFDIAEQWRAVGDNTHRAARLAGIGEIPADDQAWIDVGFTVREADRWRNFNRTHAKRFTPHDAWQWHRLGVLPNDVADIDSLPNDDPTTRAPKNRRFAHPEPTRQTALAWTSAGVPSGLVLAWYRTIGDDLDAALAWCQTIPVAKHASISAWNNQHPDHPLVPAQVQRLHRLGVPFDGTLMGRLTVAGVTPEQILRPINMLPAGKRWLGIEARAVITRAVETHRDDPHWRNLVTHVDDGNWDRIVWALRSQTVGCKLWEPLVEWLITHPAPPRRPTSR